MLTIKTTRAVAELPKGAALMYPVIGASSYNDFKPNVPVTIEGPDGQTVEGKVAYRPPVGPLIQLIMQYGSQVAVTAGQAFDPSNVVEQLASTPGEVVDTTQLAMFVPVVLPVEQTPAPQGTILGANGEAIPVQDTTPAPVGTTRTAADTSPV
jgi:hypothetical protein